MLVPAIRSRELTTIMTPLAGVAGVGVTVVGVAVLGVAVPTTSGRSQHERGELPGLQVSFIRYSHTTLGSSSVRLEGIACEE